MRQFAKFRNRMAPIGAPGNKEAVEPIMDMYSALSIHLKTYDMLISFPSCNNHLHPPVLAGLKDSIALCPERCHGIVMF